MVAQGLLRPLLGRDVGIRPEPADDHAIGVAERRYPRQKGVVLAVIRAQREDHLERLTGRQ